MSGNEPNSNNPNQYRNEPGMSNYSTSNQNPTYNRGQSADSTINRTGSQNYPQSPTQNLGGQSGPFTVTPINTANLENVFRRDPSAGEPKIITERERSPSGLSREGTPTRSNLNVPNINRPKVNIDTSAQPTNRTSVGQIDRQNSSPYRSNIHTDTDRPDSKSHRANSWEPNRSQYSPIVSKYTGDFLTFPTDQKTRLFNVSGQKNLLPSPIVSDNLFQSEVSNIDFDYGPGPELINSINLTLENAKKKGLLDPVDKPLASSKVLTESISKNQFSPPSVKNKPVDQAANYQSFGASPVTPNYGQSSNKDAGQSQPTQPSFGQIIFDPVQNQGENVAQRYGKIEKSPSPKSQSPRNQTSPKNQISPKSQTTPIQQFQQQQSATKPTQPFEQSQQISSPQHQAQKSQQGTLSPKQHEQFQQQTQYQNVSQPQYQYPHQQTSQYPQLQNLQNLQNPQIQQQRVNDPSNLQGQFQSQSQQQYPFPQQQSFQFPLVQQQSQYPQNQGQAQFQSPQQQSPQFPQPQNQQFQQQQRQFESQQQQQTPSQNKLYTQQPRREESPQMQTQFQSQNQPQTQYPQQQNLQYPQIQPQRQYEATQQQTQNRPQSPQQRPNEEQVREPYQQPQRLQSQTSPDRTTSPTRESGALKSPTEKQQPPEPQTDKAPERKKSPPTRTQKKPVKQGSKTDQGYPEDPNIPFKTGGLNFNPVYEESHNLPQNQPKSREFDDYFGSNSQSEAQKRVNNNLSQPTRDQQPDYSSPNRPPLGKPGYKASPEERGSHKRDSKTPGSGDKDKRGRGTRIPESPTSNF